MSRTSACCATRFARVGLEVQSLFVRLVEVNGRPHQIFDPALELPIPVTDLRTAPDPVAAAKDWMRAEYTAPLDLLTDRLVVMNLLQVSTQRSPLLRPIPSHRGGRVRRAHHSQSHSGNVFRSDRF